VIEPSNYPNIPLSMADTLRRWIRDGAICCGGLWPTFNNPLPSLIGIHLCRRCERMALIHPIITLHTQSADASCGCLEAGGHWWCGKPWAKHPQSHQKHSSSRRIFNPISRKVSLPP
jgi:hypothetical protein